MAAKCASKTLFVGNLHSLLTETDLLEIFRPFGRIVECCKRWCHYGFIQFATDDEARLAFTNLNGSKVKGRPMRIEFQRKKMRNLAALLEAEAQAKSRGNVASGSNNNSSADDFECQIMFMQLMDDDVENISPNNTQMSFSQLFNKQKYANLNYNNNNDNNDHEDYDNKTDNAKYSTYEIDLFKQLSFLDSDSSNNSNSGLNYGRKITNNTHSLSVASNQTPLSANQQQQQQILTNRCLNTTNNEMENTSLLTNLLSNQTKKMSTTTNQNTDEIDAKTNAWFCYLLEKASIATKTPFSLSSSPLSPNNRESSLSSNSVILYRSLNTSNTIFVQPTDILEPLEVGDFNEYKLFPTVISTQLFKGLSMSSPNKNQEEEDEDYEFAKEILVDLISPPSSVSLSSSISSSSSTSTSPLLSMRRKYRSRHHHHHNQHQHVTKC
jgi:RNA recognition motif-containing protein